MIEGGVRRWIAYVDIDYPIDWFEEGMNFLITEGIAVSGSVGAAHCVLVDAQQAVDVLIPWRQRNGFIPPNG